MSTDDAPAGCAVGTVVSVAGPPQATSKNRHDRVLIVSINLMLRVPLSGKAIHLWTIAHRRRLSYAKLIECTSLSQDGKTVGFEITNVLLRCDAPLFNLIRDGGTLNSLASCRMTSLFALPSAGGAVVLIRSRPSLTPWISLRLPRGCTRTGTTRLYSGSVPAVSDCPI